MVDQIFKERFSMLCDASGLSLRGLSKELYTSHTNIYRWCRGETIPTITSLAVIAQYFGVTYDWLLGKDEVGDGSEKDFDKGD